MAMLALLRDWNRLLVMCLRAWGELEKVAPDHPILVELDVLTGEMMDKVVEYGQDFGGVAGCG